MGQVQPLSHAERSGHPLEQREPVVEPRGAQRVGQIGPHWIPASHHQHRQSEPLRVAHLIGQAIVLRESRGRV